MEASIAVTGHQTRSYTNYGSNGGVSSGVGALMGSRVVTLAFGGAGLSNGSTAVAPRGTITCAWQARRTGDDCAPIFDVTTGLVTFNCGAATIGWLHCLTKGSGIQPTTAQVASATAPLQALRAASYTYAGFVDPLRSIPYNKPEGVPDMVAHKLVARKAGLRLQIYPVSVTGASSLATSLFGGDVVAVAHQPADSTDLDSVFVNATPEVAWAVGNGIAGTCVWVWTGSAASAVNH